MGGWLALTTVSNRNPSCIGPKFKSKVFQVLLSFSGGWMVDGSERVVVGGSVHSMPDPCMVFHVSKVENANYRWMCKPHLEALSVQKY